MDVRTNRTPSQITPAYQSVQGDLERDRGLPCSPLCDRQSTAVEQSQISFINFIVEPSFEVLTEMLGVIIEVLPANGHADAQNQTIAEEEEEDEGAEQKPKAAPDRDESCSQ